MIVWRQNVIGWGSDNWAFNVWTVNCIKTLTTISITTHVNCNTVCLFWDSVCIVTPVATLQRHLWSNVCSKFHENRGILKPISRNRNMGVFFTWNFVKPPQKGYILTPYFELSWDLSAINYFQWIWYCAIYNDVKRSVFEIVQTDKLSLCYELVNIYKYGEKSSFKHFSCFLKNMGPLKGFDFFLDFEKKACFKELKISWFHRK